MKSQGIWLVSIVDVADLLDFDSTFLSILLLPQWLLIYPDALALP